MLRVRAAPHSDKSLPDSGFIVNVDFLLPRLFSGRYYIGKLSSSYDKRKAEREMYVYHMYNIYKSSNCVIFVQNEQNDGMFAWCIIAWPSTNKKSQFREDITSENYLLRTTSGKRKEKMYVYHMYNIYKSSNCVIFVQNEQNNGMFAWCIIAWPSTNKKVPTSTIDKNTVPCFLSTTSQNLSASGVSTRTINTRTLNAYNQ